MSEKQKKEDLLELLAKKTSEDYLTYNVEDFEKNKFHLKKDLIIIGVSFLMTILFFSKTFTIFNSDLPTITKIIDLVFTFFFILILIMSFRLYIIVGVLNFERFQIIEELKSINRTLEYIEKKIEKENK